MNDPFTQRVRAAAVAGWWTVLLGAAWLLIAWLFILVILAAEPAWMLTLWGGHLDWNEFHRVIVTAMAAFKLILFVAVLVTIWLSFWARRLRRLGDG